MRGIPSLAAALGVVAIAAAGAGAVTGPPTIPLTPGSQGCTAVSPVGTPSPMGQVRRDSDADNVELDQTVLVSPPRFEFDMRRTVAAGNEDEVAGSSFTCRLTVRSRRSEPASFDIEPLGLVGSGELATGGREYVAASDERFDSTAGPWIEPAVDSIVIPSRGVAHIPFRITIPDEPPAGGAYGAVGVVSRAGARAGAANLGVETVVASSILIQLPGDAAPDLQLRDIEAPRLRWDREAWPFAAVLDNDGSLHATADGRIRIRSVFGNEVASLGIEEQRILPGASAPVIERWDQVPWIGLYRWDARVSSAAPTGAERSVAVADGWFVALPPWWVLAIVGAVLLVLLVRWLQRRAERWGELADEDDPHGDDDPGSFDFDLAERQLRS